MPRSARNWVPYGQQTGQGQATRSRAQSSHELYLAHEVQRTHGIYQAREARSANQAHGVRSALARLVGLGARWGRMGVDEIGSSVGQDLWRWVANLRHSVPGATPVLALGSVASSVLSSALGRLLMGAGLAGLAAVTAFRWRMLTRRGARAAWLLGTALFFGGGWGASLLLLIFFFSSSVLSRLPESSRRRPRATRSPTASTCCPAVHESTRSDRQVWANGGVATVIALLGQFASWMNSSGAVPRWAYRIGLFGLTGLTGLTPAFLGLLTSLAWAGVTAAIAEAAADTWASEIGRRYGGTPRRLRDWQPVAAGASGGVTLVGTLAAAFAALLLATVSLAFARWGWYPWPAVWGVGEMAAPPPALALAGTALAAWAGVWADSWLGATVQARFWCPRCQAETESRVHRCGHPTRCLSGWYWLDNDGVNALSTGLAAALAILLQVAVLFR